MSDAASRLPKLLVKAPQGGTKEVEVSETPFTIGRKPDNHLCLDDPAASGHHARIVKVQEVLFIEDQRSTNGIFVNEQKIDRKQLRDTDSIRIGTHRLIFRHEDSAAAASKPVLGTADTDKTMVVSASMASAATPVPQKIGIVEVLSGKTTQSQYRLTKQVSLIGSQEDAAIRLTGWFAPKSAAVIGRRPEGYYVGKVEGGKPVLVNKEPLEGQQMLLDGDVVETAGISLQFHLRDAKKAAA
ncbi:MAG: FHA domain-containing protein [Nitrospiraceae bacterium]|nr:FHA domain-containing protein [Nitrospiraceae bacterium]